MKKMWIGILASGCLLGCQNEIATPVAAAADSKGDQTAAFEMFKSIAGSYEEVSEKDKYWTVEYKLISRGSALMERWRYPSDEGERVELTMFHLDNGVFKATHYCASGIQSNMVLSTDSPSGRYEFSAVTTTNQADPDSAFNSGFAYEFEEGKIQRDEYWTEAGKVSSSNLTFEKQ